MRMPACPVRAIGGLAAFVMAVQVLSLATSVRAGESTPPSQQILVFAAASLKGALDEASESFSKARGVPVVISFAGTSALARQIEHGAPADVIISADETWMDYLAGKDLIRKATRRALLSNRLVLVAPAERAQPVDVAAAGHIAMALAGGRLAVADVKAVPAGRYAKAALESLGQWASVSAHLAQAENVRAALAFVARGEAPLGIVYETDARAEPGVAIVATFPASSHPRIVYPAAVTAVAAAPGLGADYLNALGGDEAAGVLRRHGFTVLPAQP